MVVLAYSLVQHCFGVAAVATSTVGEGIGEEGTVDEETVDEETIDEEVGYEKNDFLDGSFSNQDTKKFVGLSVVPKVTKS